MTDTSDSNDRRVAHAETIKVVNNRFSTPVTLKFFKITKEKNINIAHKNIIIFTTIRLFDPTAVIKSQKEVIYNHTKDFTYNYVYKDAFDIIIDENSHLNFISTLNTQLNPHQPLTISSIVRGISLTPYTNNKNSTAQ